MTCLHWILMTLAMHLYPAKLIGSSKLFPCHRAITQSNGHIARTTAFLRVTIKLGSMRSHSQRHHLLCSQLCCQMGTYKSHFLAPQDKGWWLRPQRICPHGLPSPQICCLQNRYLLMGRLAISCNAFIVRGWPHKGKASLSLLGPSVLHFPSLSCASRLTLLTKTFVIPFSCCLLPRHPPPPEIAF